MNALTWIHIAGGSIALLAGCAGTVFVVAMLVLGVTASILSPMKAEPDSPVDGILVCYFVLTAWAAARRRDGATGRLEMIACAFALGLAVLIFWGGLTGATTPAGTGPIFAIGLFCLLAGLGDLRAVLRKKLSPVQRLSRHVWRMCFAFFIATGSFFIGQQDVMPASVRGSLWLFVLGFAPFGVMLFWLARLRFAKAIARSKQTGRMLIGRKAEPAELAA
jgi:hypothetical protein